MQVGACGGGAPEGTDSAGDGVRAASPTLSASAVPPPPPPPRLRRRDLWACNLVLFKFSFFPPFSFLKIFFFSSLRLLCWSSRVCLPSSFPAQGSGDASFAPGGLSCERGQGLPGRDFSSWVSSPWETLHPGVGQIRGGAQPQGKPPGPPPHPTPPPTPARAAAAVGSEDVFIPV